MTVTWVFAQPQGSGLVEAICETHGCAPLLWEELALIVLRCVVWLIQASLARFDCCCMSALLCASFRVCQLCAWSGAGTWSLFALHGRPLDPLLALASHHANATID